MREIIYTISRGSICSTSGIFE